MPTVEKPLVSIITVCLNSEKHLEQTIRSVIEQTYSNLEYIIIDGGSSDNTIAIIKKYQDYVSCWISEPDKGIFDAMNKGIGLASGEWIGIINSDDWYNSNAVAWIVNESYNKPNVDVFHGNVIVVDREGKYELKKGSADYFSENRQLCVHHPTCFIKKEVYNKYKYDLKYKLSADREFILRLLKNGNVFFYLDLFMVYYRITGSSNHPYFKSIFDRYKIRKIYYNKNNARKFLIKDFISYFDEIMYLYSGILKEKLKKADNKTI